MLEDEGKYYVIIEVSRGSMQPLRENEYRFGADLIRKKDPVLLTYLEKEEKITRQVLGSLQNNKKEPETLNEDGTAVGRLGARISELDAYLKMIEETRHEMQ